jgi:hypothetical protein
MHKGCTRRCTRRCTKGVGVYNTPQFRGEVVSFFLPEYRTSPSPALPSPPLRRFSELREFSLPFTPFFGLVLLTYRRHLDILTPALRRRKLLVSFSLRLPPFPWFSRFWLTSFRRLFAAFPTGLRRHRNVQHSPALSVAAGQRSFSAGVAPRMRSLFEAPVCRARTAMCARWHHQQVSALHWTPQGVSPAGKSPDRGRRSPSV